jgi:hypothetical protein
MSSLNASNIDWDEPSFHHIILNRSLTVGMSTKTLKHIAVDEQNYLILKRLGSTGDSFNDALSRLLKSTRWEQEEGYAE